MKSPFAAICFPQWEQLVESEDDIDQEYVVECINTAERVNLEAQDVHAGHMHNELLYVLVENAGRAGLALATCGHELRFIPLDDLCKPPKGWHKVGIVEKP